MYVEKQFWQDLKSGKFVSMVSDSAKGEILKTPSEVFNVMKPLFIENDDVESIYGIFLNSKNRVKAIEKLASGSISSSMVYPREIIKRILALKSNAIILVHNHPSGCPEPSKADFDITLRIAIALDNIGSTLHDHIIIGDSYYSLADSGWMDELREKVSAVISL